MKVELLLGAAEFWARLKEDLGAARHRAYVQTFSFEGDRVGAALGRALERSPAKDRRLLVDGFSLLYHNDRLIPGPAWIDRSFRSEVLRTHRWVRRLQRGGCSVRFGNPLGPSPTRLVRRNHKKLALVDDDVAYLGGINFSDHNFAWHDMMYRVECPDVGSVLADDFRDSWDGSPMAMDRSVGPLRILSLNGRGNARGMQPILDAVDRSEHAIDIVSPYLSHPFTRHLAAAARRGVRVRVLTPADNNKPNLAHHIHWTARRCGLEVYRFAGGMSHLKAMLIDGEQLVIGSTNFDFMSYHILEELVIMTRDPTMVRGFVDRVWRPDLEAARAGVASGGLAAGMGHAAVHLGAATARLLAIP